MSEYLKRIIRDIPDFPKEGVIYKDITPLLSSPEYFRQALQDSLAKIKPLRPEAIAGIEARGFLFGFCLAEKLGIPFIPLRKAGKLPYKTLHSAYKLEYGEAELEMHVDALYEGQRILIHDDVLATGGTAAAAAHLIQKGGGECCGFHFIMSLNFLNGRSKLQSYSEHIESLVEYR